MTSDKLGERIQDILHHNRITQSQLADRVMKNRQQISQYLNGHVTMGFDVLIDIADALDISLDELTGRYQYVCPDKAILPIPEKFQSTQSMAQEDIIPYGRVTAIRNGKQVDITDELLTQIRLDKLEDIITEIFNDIKSLKKENK